MRWGNALASRVKQASNGFRLGEFIVQRNRVLRRQDVDWNLPFLQKLQRLVRHVKALAIPRDSTTTFAP